jgi:hypothetical protein
VKEEMAWTCSVQVENEKCIQNFSWKASRELGIPSFARKNNVKIYPRE